jgi:hypothetical protein
MAKDMYDIVSKLLSLQLVVTISISLLIFFFAVGQDYIVYELHASAQNLVDINVMGDYIVTAIENVDNIYLTFPAYFDYLWLGLFLTLIGELVVSAYKVKRMGYGSALGFLTFGTLIFLFITAIYSQISNWFQLNFVGLMLPNFLYVTPFFNFYLRNVGIIHLLIIVACILVNVFDFKVAEYVSSKTDVVIEKVKSTNVFKKISSNFNKTKSSNDEVL